MKTPPCPRNPSKVISSRCHSLAPSAFGRRLLFDAEVANVVEFLELVLTWQPPIRHKSRQKPKNDFEEGGNEDDHRKGQQEVVVDSAIQDG